MRNRSCMAVIGAVIFLAILAFIVARVMFSQAAATTAIPSSVPPENRDVAPLIYALCGSPLFLGLGLLGTWQVVQVSPRVAMFFVVAAVVAVLVVVALASFAKDQLFHE